MDFRYSHEGCKAAQAFHFNLQPFSYGDLTFHAGRPKPGKLARATQAASERYSGRDRLSCHHSHSQGSLSGGAWAWKSFFAQEPCSAVLAAMDRLSHLPRFFTVTRQFYSYFWFAWMLLQSFSQPMLFGAFTFAGFQCRSGVQYDSHSHFSGSC